MFTTRDLFWGIPVPALIAAIVMSIAWQPWRTNSPASGYWGGALAIGMGFAVAYLGLTRKLPNPQLDVTDWLFVIAIVSILFGCVDGLFAIPTWIRRCIGLCAFATFCWLLLRPLSDLSSGATAGWIIALALIMSAWCVLLDGFGQVERGPIVPLLLTIVAAATGLVLLLSGSQRLGQLGGAFAASVGACAVVAFVAKWLSLSRGGIFAYVSIGASLLICGRFYASVTAINALLLLAAGLLTSAGHIVPTRLLHGWKRQLSLIVVVLVPAVTAVVLAAIEFAASMNEYSY